MDTDLIEAHINAISNPVEWGKDECAFWVADVLETFTGVDLAASWRGTYSTEDEAYAEMKRRGGGLVRHVFSAVQSAGWKRVEPTETTGPALGLVHKCNADGTEIYVVVVSVTPGWFMARGDIGMTAVPADMVRRAWQP